MIQVEQLYTSCLAQGAYYIESNGEAAVIDPLRDMNQYIELAESRGAKIKYIFETHFHADFVSGHVDLAKKTGATIVYGPSANTKYEIHVGTDNEIFNIGNAKVKLLHTPGHTMESSCFLLFNDEGKEEALFSGDTVFLGDVGRPDLAIKSDVTEADLAGFLYDSIWNKIMPLPDHILVYPGHGAGSSCGKNMSDDTVDTLGNQKKTNYALQKITKEEFVAQVTDGLASPPQYFPKNAALNINGYESIDAVMERGMKKLSVADVEKEIAAGALIVDSRHEQIFNKGFIKNAVNFPLDGQYAVWVGTLIEELQQPIIMVASADEVKEAITRLARVGYDNVVGYLEGGYEAWEKAGKETSKITSISVQTLEKILADGENLNILDVRKPNEYLSQRIDGSEHCSLNDINENMSKLDKNKTYHIHCQGGYRSMIFSSILVKNGFTNLVDIAGGFDEIKESNIKLTNFVCPSEL